MPVTADLATQLWTTSAAHCAGYLGSIQRQWCRPEGQLAHTEVSGMGNEDQIGVSTGEATQAAGNAATAAEQYERIDLDFRATIMGVSDAVVEPPVVTGASLFCEEHVYDLVRLRAHMQALGENAVAGGRAAGETDRGNAERFGPWAV